MAITYQQFKEIKQQTEIAVAHWSQELNKFPKGELGLTPDAVKSSEPFRIAKGNFRAEFEKLRNINTYGNKFFNKEQAAEREEKRKQAEELGRKFLLEEKAKKKTKEKPAKEKPAKEKPAKEKESPAFRHKNPKIDIFDKKTKDYLGSTNFFKTCKEAKAHWLETKEKEVLAKKSKR